MAKTYRVTDEYAYKWREIEADDLHEAAENYVRTVYSEDTDIARDGSIRVTVRAPEDMKLEYEFAVHVDYLMTYTAKMIHKEPTDAD